MTDPYPGIRLAEIAQANLDDVDDALRAARNAQRGWAAALPGQRAYLLCHMAS